jgi:hypothetical protein
MTLATHAIVGAMAAELVPQYPVLGFALGFMSHLAIDSLPHYDYSLSSVIPAPDKDFRKLDIVLGRKLLGDLIPLGLDCSGGFLIAAALFNNGPYAILIALGGAVGGVLPDALHFVYSKTHARALLSLQSFHSAIQKHNAFEGRPLPGLTIQFAVIILFGTLLRFLGKL